MIATKTNIACRALRTPLAPARPFSSLKRQSVVMRFMEDIRPEFAKNDVEKQDMTAETIQDVSG